MNPETSKKTKRIVAREGLFFLLLLFGIIFLLLENHYTKVSYSLADIINSILESPDAINERRDYLNKALWFHRIGISLVLAYCASFVIRFIVWAVKTLREK